MELLRYIAGFTDDNPTVVPENDLIDIATRAILIGTAPKLEVSSVHQQVSSFASSEVSHLSYIWKLTFDNEGYLIRLEFVCEGLHDYILHQRPLLVKEMRQMLMLTEKLQEHVTTHE